MRPAFFDAGRSLRRALQVKAGVGPAVMVTSDSPTFDEAVSRFRRFVKERGGPDRLTFVKPDDVVFRGADIVLRPRPQQAAESEAGRLYGEALKRGHGVLLGGLCSLEESTCVFVGSPSSPEETERLLYPSGLKLSLREPLPKATLARAVAWRWLKLREWLYPTPGKEELFK